MNTRTPLFRTHSTSGQYMIRWGGRVYYLGRDRDAAYAQYLDHLKRWAEWRQARQTQRLAPPTQAILVPELIDQFLEWKGLERGDETRRYYEKHLRRFRAWCGALRADAVRPQHLHKVKQEMMQGRYAPKTIAHDLTAIRVLFNYACGEVELIPPVNFRGVKNPPLGPPPDRALGRGQVRRMFRQATPGLTPWLWVNYLALLRPSEVVKCVRREGKWVKPWLFRLDRGKMDRIAMLPRHCIFSELALKHLAECRPVWSRLDSYSAATRRACGKGPGLLRHSAATHLEELAPLAGDHIEFLLGHTPTRLRLTYRRPPWPAIRQTAELLAASFSSG